MPDRRIDHREAWKMGRTMPPGRPIIAVDPGKTTGYALLTPDGIVFAGQEDWDEAMVVVRDSLNLWLPYRTLLVVESFVITEATAKNSQAPWALEGIGVARFLARRNGAELKLQKPVEAKNFATNARLKAQGWYLSTPGGHANDALRHLYLALVELSRLVPPEGVI